MEQQGPSLVKIVGLCVVASAITSIATIKLYEKFDSAAIVNTFNSAIQGFYTEKSFVWTSVDDYLKNYECQHNYSARVVNRDPPVILIDNFLQEGEEEVIRSMR